MHDQLSAFGIGDDWNDHIARGSSGGVDFLTPVGTPVEAPEDGYISNIAYNGTGGHTVTLYRDANHSTQFMHLSRLVAADRYVKEFDIIGYTGGAAGSDGAGSSTGPHCHAHSYDFGVRVPPFFLGFTAGIPGTSTPNRKAAAVTVPYSVFKYVDTVNADRWFLAGSLGNVEIPGDGTERQLANMCEGLTTDLGPNALVTLGRMQTLEVESRKAIATGGPRPAEFTLSDDERARIADAVNDEAAARLKG